MDRRVGDRRKKGAFVDKQTPPVVRLFDICEVPRVIRNQLFCTLFEQLESNLGEEFYLYWDRAKHKCPVVDKWFSKQSGCYTKIDNVRILFRYHDSMGCMK